MLSLLSKFVPLSVALIGSLGRFAAHLVFDLVPSALLWKKQCKTGSLKQRSRSRSVAIEAGNSLSKVNHPLQGHFD